MNWLPRGQTGERMITDREGGCVMWTKAMLLFAFLAVALLLGIHLGLAWVQQAMLQ